MRLVNDSPQAVLEAAATHAGPLTGRRFVILGEGRLSCAVDRHLTRRQATVTTNPIHSPSLEADLIVALRGAECVLALSEDHEANLRVALVAARTRPEVPIVIRAFDPALADEVEKDPPRGRVARSSCLQHVPPCRAPLRGRRAVGRGRGDPLDAPDRRGLRCRLSPAACDCGRSDEIVLGGRLVDVPHVARRRSHVGHDRSQHPRHLSAILVVAIGAKFAGAEAGAHLAGAAPRASLALGALMNTRGLMELVVLNIGFELGVMEPRLYTLFVVMAIVTTVMTDPLVRWIRPPLDLRLRAGR